MAYTYAKYWGGDLIVKNLPGLGVDAYVLVNKDGMRIENLKVEGEVGSRL